MFENVGHKYQNVDNAFGNVGHKYENVDNVENVDNALENVNNTFEEHVGRMKIRMTMWAIRMTM